MEITLRTTSETHVLAWKPAICPACGEPHISAKALRVHFSHAHRILKKKRGRRKVVHVRRRAAKKKGETLRGKQSAPVSVREVREDLPQS